MASSKIRIGLITLAGVAPAVLVYLGKDQNAARNVFGTIFTTPEALSTAQQWMFWIGLAWAGAILPYRFACQSEEMKSLKEDYGKLLKASKKSLFTALEQSLGTSSANLKTRIFVPRTDPLAWIVQWLRKRISLMRSVPRMIHTKDIPSITDAFEPGHLSFEVSPQQEGMVGLVFTTPKLMIDDDVESNNTYVLSDKKKHLLQDVKFCAAIPILVDGPPSKAKKNGHKVRAVLSIDCEKQIKLNEPNKKVFATFMVSYATFIETYQKL